MAGYRERHGRSRSSLQHNPNISESSTATSAPAAPKKRPPLAQAARTFLKGVTIPTSVIHEGEEYFITEDEQERVIFLMTVMTLFAYGLENGSTEMTVNVSRPQLAEIMHRSVKTVGRRIALAKVLGLLKSESKGNHGEYVVAQKQGHYVVPVEEVINWAKHRKSGPLELRNDTSPATTQSTEDTQLHNSRGGHPTRTPTVPDVVSSFAGTQQGHADERTGTQEKTTGTQKQENGDNVVSSTGVLPTGFNKNSGVVPTGASPTMPVSQATEVVSSDSTDKWPETKTAGPASSSGLVVQATKKPDIPECPSCQVMMLIEPNLTGKYCPKHDTPGLRLT